MYRHGDPPCTGIGMAWTSAELNAAISGPVARLLFDDEGTETIEQILSALADTEFAQSELRRILSLPEAIEDWRAGEAIAEAYLTKHRSCHFPWPSLHHRHARHGDCHPGQLGRWTERQGYRQALPLSFRESSAGNLALRRRVGTLGRRILAMTNLGNELRQRILSGQSDTHIRFADLRAFLLRPGFAERARGSHHIFRKEGVPERLNIQREGSHAKPYQVRQVR